MARKDPVRGPMESGFPMNSVDGDKRDIHDQNPWPPESEAKHSMSKDTLPIVFFEGEDNIGDCMGRVAEKTRDIFSSPMTGQRNSGTGERTSPDSTLGCEFKKK